MQGGFGREKQEIQLEVAESTQSTNSALHANQEQIQAEFNTMSHMKQEKIDQKIRLLQFEHMNQYFAEKEYRSYPGNLLNTFSIIAQKDPHRVRFSEIFRNMGQKNVYDPNLLQLTEVESRGIAVMLGNAIGDALGAATQFEYFKKEGYGLIKNGFKDIEEAVEKDILSYRSGRNGIWTDDNSMALCLADSVLLSDYQFIPKHIRYLFILWLEHGLNNGGRPHSIGLGGNISISMDEFMHTQNDFTNKGNQFNNGNGSLMRLSPIPVAYHDDLQKGIEYSGLQSLTTHNGVQAQHCSRLMAKIIIGLINRPKEIDGKALLIDICDKFQTPIDSVRYLACGQQQPQELYDRACMQNQQYRKFNRSLEDRNWNWREESFMYSPCRNKHQPGYIGSYCMDALSMALHTVLFTKSFKEVVTRNADMGGDCDTVGAIAGQIAGAMYGIDKEMLQLYSEMVDWKEKRYEVFLKGFALIKKLRLIK